MVDLRVPSWVRRISWRPTRLQAGAFFLVVLLFVADFFGRVYVPRDAELRRFAAPTIPAAPVRSDAGATQALLESWFPAPVAKDVEAEKTLSLRGVFMARGSRRAVVAVVGPDGAVERYQLVNEGQELVKWTINRIDRLVVTVSRGDETRELRMFPSKSDGANE